MRNGPIRRQLSAVMAAMVLLLSSGDSDATLNASGTGQWISIGVPTYVHLGTNGGTNGDFYMNGSDQGSCQSVTPSHFRFDMSQPHWKEMYALLLYAAANQKSLECTVDSGCGTTYVWVSYCRTPL